MYMVLTAVFGLPYQITFNQNLTLELEGDYNYQITIAAGVTVNFKGDVICATLTNTTGTVSIGGNLYVALTLTNGSGNILVYGHARVLASGGAIDNTDGNITIRGNCLTRNMTTNGTGLITISGRCQVIEDITQAGTGGFIISRECIAQSIIQTGNGSIVLQNNVFLYTNLVNSNGETIIYGHLYCSNVNNTGGFAIVVRRDAFLKADLTNTTGTIDISGNCRVDNLTNGVGTITIEGIARIYGTIVNTGTLTYRSYHPDTRFFQEAVGATVVNGITWKDLLDRSGIDRPVRICGFTVTVAGGWAGNAKIRIVDGAGTTKIFPFKDEWVENTDFTSATQKTFDFPCDVSPVKGYKFQFRSSNAGDGAGKTLALNNLDVQELS